LLFLKGLKINKIMDKKNIVLIVFSALLLVSLGLLVYTQFIAPENQCRLLKKTKEAFLPPQEAANLALKFINSKLLQGNAQASLDGNVTEEKNLYKFAISIQGQKFDVYTTKDGKLLFPQAISLDEKQVLAKDSESTNTNNNNEESNKAKSEKTTIGYFSVTNDEICKENDKPIIYFFGSSGCPHCRWEHPLIEEVAKEFKDYISFHNNMDSFGNDEKVFQKYSDGGVPTIVLGCKYYRLGSGEGGTQDEEKNNLRAIICKLTNGKPEAVCSKVQDLITKVP
jgi:thiol-disulfide isomerase/thioredoxin